MPLLANFQRGNINFDRQNGPCSKYYFVSSTIWHALAPGGKKTESCEWQASVLPLTLGLATTYCLRDRDLEVTV